MHLYELTKFERRRQSRQHKSPAFYWWVLAAWAALYGAAIYATLPVMQDAFRFNPVCGSLVVITMGFIGYFWLNGTKDVAFNLCYHPWLKDRIKLPPVANLLVEPKVALVYCTYNDFNGASLLDSMCQEYSNFLTVILDDSTKPEYKEMIDNFAGLNGLRVIRRADNVGFKAGNLNNYLMGALKKEGIDYFVILDSDEIIPANFIRRSLDYFAAYQHVGIVQANHIATRNRNWFMRKFSIGVDSHWPVYQTVKDRFGFLSLLGHGAMVSKKCYYAAGGFPHVVAEDINFSLDARKAGYLTMFAPDITCEEEYPADYVAFEKRHGKWTEGNLEFIKQNTVSIMSRKSGLRWFEKLDIVLFTYSLPLTAFFFTYVLINVFAFPLMGYRLQYPLWMLAPTALFLVAPMLNDIVYYWRTLSKRELFSYLIHSTLLYGSMLPVSFLASIKSFFKGSVFTVTPKDSNAMTLWESVRFNRNKLIFALALATAVIYSTGSVLAVFLIVIPSLFGIYLTVSHMRTSRV